MDHTPATTPRRKVNQKILQLAKEVSESRDRKVPAVLLALRPILKEHPAATEQGRALREEIWQYNLLKVLVLVLRQDYSVVTGQWGTAAQLADLVSLATCGLGLSGKDKRELEDEHLPKCVENMLLLARHIHTVMGGKVASQESTSKESMVSDLVIHCKSVLDALLQLCAGYFYICVDVLSSQWLLQLLVSDNNKISNITMATMEKLLRLDPQLLKKTEETALHTLLDELVYKLTVNTDVSLAASACRCLIRFCDHHKPLVEALCSRYKGLRPLLKRWEGHGFERDLRHLSLLLESGSAVKARSHRQHQCACFIQAVWRGFSTRQKLRKANRAFAKFQKAYRLKKAEQEQVKLATQFQSELYHLMKMRRQQLMRQFLQKKLQTMEILPASRIEEYLKKEKAVAATCIQTLWRGHRERTRLSQRQKVAQQVRAVIRIQRAFRKWLEKRESLNQDFPTHLKPPGLTDVRREELRKKMSEWREQNPTTIETHEELESVYQRAHELLAHHYRHIRPYRKLQYQMENLSARLDTDMELVALAPKLSDVTQKDVDMYSSRSLPVATLAKSQHNLMMRKLQQPWWKVLGMDDLEVDEDEKERVEAEVLLETMGV